MARHRPRKTRRKDRRTLSRCALAEALRLRRSRSSSATAARLNFDPHVVAAHLATEAMNAFAANGGAAPVREPKPPLVQGTDDLSFFEPAVTERSSRVRAPAGQGHHVSRQSGSRPAAGQPHRASALALPRGRRAGTTTTHSGMRALHVPRGGRNRKTNTLGLASEESNTLDSTVLGFTSKVRTGRRELYTVKRPVRVSRPSILAAALDSAVALAASGCGLERSSTPDLVWGLHGTKPGHLYKPRVAAFDAKDHLFLADLTDRIQIFDRDGHYLRGWRTPEFNVDGPSGLTIDRYGRLLVADTHFYRVLVYSADGRASVPDRRRRAGNDAGTVRLSDRRRHRPRGQFLRRRVW